MLQMGLHPSEILIGYEKASVQAHLILEKQVCYTLKDIHDEEEVFKCMRAAVASKQYGLEDLLGRLITQACLYAIPKGGSSFSTDNIRVQKILGGGI
jgi:T-complex protein 1 subunit theta